MRPASHDPEPHRTLKVDLKDPQHGEDVRALQVAALRRLSARGIDRDLKIDGRFGPTTADVCDTAAHFLGALSTTTKAPLLSIGAQRMIRYPGTRTPQQLARARARLDDLADQRAHPPVPKAGNAVARALAAFDLAYRHRGEVHYTMGGSRWQGIHTGLRADKGQFPRYADCSSIFTWCYWQTLGHGPDVVNGLTWGAGYTGTLLSHGRRLDRPQPGCAIIYGHHWPGVHVAMYDKNGMCYSHGSERGPLYVNYRYRSDILAIRAYA